MLSGARENKLLRYIIVGGLSYALELVVLILLVDHLMLPGVTSVAIAFWVGLGASFALQKLVAFRNRTSNKETFKQAILYITLVAINYGFTIVFVYMTEHMAGVVAARTVALIATTCWNYLAYRNVIFKDNR